MADKPAIDFNFPYDEPYPSQLDLMKSIYECIDEGKIGIFESPTGTGKSLSLLCSSLTWLKKDKENLFKENEISVVDNGKQPLWLQKQTAKLKQNKLKDAYIEKLETLEKLKLLESQALKKMSLETSSSHQSNKRPKLTLNLVPEDEESEFLLEEVDLDSESNDMNTNLKKLLEKVDNHLYGHLSKNLENDLEEPEFTKIYYCSRTHSQLSQLVSEFTKTKFPKGFDLLTYKGLQKTKFSTVTLGSRTNLCINDRLNTKMTSNSRLNDSCLELQKPGIDSKKRCVYYLPSQRPLLSRYAEFVLHKPQDIEDLVKLGYKTNCCPYYGTRKAIPRAQLVCLPYNLILNSQARKALNIDLNGQIIIFDEAHNLINSVESTLTVEIYLHQLEVMKEGLDNYIKRFNTRLSGLNQMMCKQIKLVVNQLVNYFNTNQKVGSENYKVEESTTLDPNNFLHQLKLDNLDLHKLIEYLTVSKLHHKLNGYIQCASGKDNEARKEVAIFTLQQLLLTLSFNDGTGKFIIDRKEKRVKYLLLNTADTFQNTIQLAKSVVLLGGTLAPQHMVESLMPGLKDRIVAKSFPHIIPPQNLLTLTLGKDGKGTEFKFNFKTKDDVNMLDKLIFTILDVVTDVPDGVIVFFASFSSLDTFVNRIVKLNLMAKLKSIKPTFLEKSYSSLDKLLLAYQTSIDNSKGGLLLSVMGGKLSEGIDFKDRYGRLVVIVGFPFPNIRSLELQLKLEDTERKFSKHKKEELYLNLTFQPLNQAIGRVIRHKLDYAAVLLIDSRWNTDPRHLQRLPSWILPSVTTMEHTQQVKGKLNEFFAGKV